MSCHVCGADEDYRRCAYCDREVCREHHLPEKHDCPNIDALDDGRHFESAMQAKQDDDDTQRRVDTGRRLETTVIKGDHVFKPDSDGFEPDDGDDETPPPPDKCEDCNSGDGLQHTCNYCNSSFCSTHRLPEKHNCISLKADAGGKHFESAAPDSDAPSPTEQRRQRVRENATSKRENRVSDREEAVSRDPDPEPVEPVETAGTTPPSECEDCDAPDGFTYSCNYCGETFCPRHRLPEQHDCPEVNGGVPTKPPGDNSRSGSSDGDSYETIDPSPGQTYGGIPDTDEVIDDSSPDVALDGSIAGEESEPLDSDSNASEQSSRLSAKSVVVLVVLIVAIGVAAFVLL